MTQCGDGLGFGRAAGRAGVGLDSSLCTGRFLRHDACIPGVGVLRRRRIAAAGGTAGACGLLVHGDGSSGLDSGFLTLGVSHSDLASARVFDFGVLSLNGHVGVRRNTFHRAGAGNGSARCTVGNIVDGRSAACGNNCAGSALRQSDIFNVRTVFRLDLAVHAADRHVICRGVVQNDRGVIAGDCNAADVFAAADGHDDIVGGDKQAADGSADGHVIGYHKNQSAAGADCRTGLVRIGLDGTVKNGNGSGTGDVVLRRKTVGGHAANDTGLNECGKIALRIGGDVRGVGIPGEVRAAQRLDPKRSGQHDHGPFTGNGRIRRHGAIAVSFQNACGGAAVDSVIIPGVRRVIDEACVLCGGQLQESCQNGGELCTGKLTVRVKLAVAALDNAVAAPAFDGGLGPVARGVAVGRLRRACAYREQTDCHGKRKNER